MAQLPVVALVGRPNVGKSTLFNRIVGRRLAVVHDAPGTTRDRQLADAEWAGVSFMLVDTGGIEDLRMVSSGAAEPLASDSASFITEIRQQAEIAIAEADVIVMVTDLTTGVTSADEEIADILRRSSKPVIVAASKGEAEKARAGYMDFYSLGLGEVIAISGMHGTNVGDLLDAVIDALPRRVSSDKEPEEEEDIPRIAIVGRPNVGKSSLLNRIMGQERVIVSPVAGTTRDSIDTRITYYGEPVILIDTAGIRRRGRIEPGVEKYSVLRALKALKRADVALLLIDAIEGITAQDAHVAGYILEENVSTVVVVNKWDAVEKDSFTIVEYTTMVRDTLKFMDYVPVLFVSALTGQRVSGVLPLALEVREGRYMRLPTAQVNRIVRDAIMRQQPPTKAGKRLKIRYASQVAVNPPKFLFHVNDPDLVHFSYQRYLENRIREAYPFTGTPIKMEFRRSRPEDE